MSSHVEVDVWTIEGQRQTRAVRHDDGCTVEIADDLGVLRVSYECRERELWRFVPVSVIATLLRAAGYVVTAPTMDGEEKTT